MTNEVKSKSGGPVGLLLLGLALAVVVAIIGWRSFGGDDGAGDAVAVEDTGPPTLEELQARAEANPDDPGAWQELGFARFQRNEFTEAAGAYEKSVALDDGNAVLWSSLGEARVMGSERDPMPASALEAFRKALERDPDDPRARYFMAVQRDLSGDHSGALDDWLALLNDTPPGAPWETDLARTIEQVGKINDIPTESRVAAAQKARTERFAMETPTSGMPGVPPLTATQAIPGPTREQMTAASKMTASQQQEMVEGMVASREQKQRENPQDVDGWVLLMRSYVTLDRTEQARAALVTAIEANPASRSRLEAEAEALGVR